MSDNSNQPAFPHYSKVFEVSQTPGFQKNYKQITSFEIEGGLTKREYFAGLAMQGMLANPEILKIMNDKVPPQDAADYLSIAAIEQAESLLTQLSKKK